MEIDIPLLQEYSLKIAGLFTGLKKYPTARLQKGFILFHQGRELAEEAVGFGFPVLKKGLLTLFPGGVELGWTQNGSTWNVDAIFKLNLVEKISRKGNGTVENSLFYDLKNFLAALIRRFPFLRTLLTSISNRLRQIFNWETTYQNGGNSVEIKMNYTIEGDKGKIVVEIDTSSLPPGISEVVIMNEQGAHVFNQYLDSSGVCLQGDEIGCWDEVKAGEAWFESSSDQLIFKLAQVNGARLFRGRELVNSRLAWAGFGYSFPPTVKILRYELKIERLS